MDYMIKGIFIGMVFGVPAGAIGALTIRRSLQYGFWAGLVTGLGSTAADICYALAGILGITLIQEFVTKWQQVINIVGGGIIIWMGISVFRKKVDLSSNEVEHGNLIGMFVSSFVLAILNPATILSFLAVFAMLQIETGGFSLKGLGLVAGIAIGTSAWWLFLSALSMKLKERLAEKMYQKLFRILGAALIVFGCVIII